MQRQRNRNRNNAEEQRGNDAGLVSVDLRQQTNPRANNEESNSNEREFENVKFRVVSEELIQHFTMVNVFEELFPSPLIQSRLYYDWS